MKSGVPQQNLDVYKDNVLCIRRNPEMNYHTLIENFRKDSCPLNVFRSCGSPTDDSKRYCLPLSSNCSMNAFNVFNIQNKSLSLPKSNKTDSFDEKWNITKIFDNPNNNPIASIYI